jgi:predicted hotdog family 3-hydroxylacyl-ACP dehydratase
MNFPLSIADTTKLLPQEHPFVFVSRLESMDETQCVTSFDITAGQVLVVDGILTASALVENMAQSCAAMMGARGKMLGEAPKVGFIGDDRFFNCSFLPSVGDTIFTEIVIENQIFDVTMVSGKVKYKGEQIATCKMKIFVQAKQ